MDEQLDDEFFNRADDHINLSNEKLRYINWSQNKGKEKKREKRDPVQVSVP